MIRYRKYQMKNGLPTARGKWYARPVPNYTLDIEALAQHMSDHNTPFSPGVIKGVLTDMVSCIKELILDGKNVKLDDLAIFSCGLVSKKGAETAETFKVADCVKGVRLRARATGVLSSKSLNLEATLRELNEYAVGADAKGNGGKPNQPGNDPKQPGNDPKQPGGETPKEPVDPAGGKETKPVAGGGDAPFGA